MKSYLKTFYLAVLAGFCIAIGAVSYLIVTGVAGAVLFSVGLIMIVTASLNLFTGKVGYAIDKPILYILDLIIIWIGNFAGTGLSALLIRLASNEKAVEAAKSISEAKLLREPAAVFFLAIFCGALMFLAVNGYKTIIDPVGKYAAVIFGVAAFIVCGFEHCIANMFYFSLADAWNIKAILYILIVTAGNALGSFLFSFAALKFKSNN